MAVINGFLTEGAQGGIANPYTSVAMRGFANEWYPYHSSLRDNDVLGYAMAQWPVEANGSGINGFASGSYSDDFYHRIHVSPPLLGLGNIISTQTQAVTVWNSYFTAVPLAAIEGVVGGVELSGQSEPPLSFNALQVREWQVAVTPDGPAVLNTTLQWVFNNGDIAALIITGNRITAFAWVPDWENGVRERLIFATDILQSPRGVEQRRALRLAPRRELSGDFIIDGAERQAFDLALFGWGSRIWAVPFFPDIQHLTVGVATDDIVIPCDTVDRDFRANGLAMLRSENAFQYETVEIESFNDNSIMLKRPLQNNWPIGTRLYPVRTARITQAERARLTDMAQRVAISFEIAEPCDWPSVFPALTYQGYPVYDQVPEESQDLTSSFASLTLLLDNGSGIPLLTDTSGKAMPVQQHRWLLYGRAERAAFRSLFYALRGRQKPLWLPTHADDLTLVATVTTVATVIDIRAIGYTRFGQAKVGRRDIRIWLHDGTVFYRRITGAAEISSSVERLAIDTALGMTVAPSDVMRISFVQLMRSDSDNLEINHMHDGDGIATAQLVFRGVRDDDL